MGYENYSKIDFNTYMPQYTAPAYTVDNTNYVNTNVSGRYSYSPNNIYSNPNKPKSEAQQTYDAWDAWLRRYGNIQYQTSQSNGSTKSDVTGSKVSSKLTDDTKIPVDLGNGETAEITYKDLNENIAAYANKIEHQEKELKKIKENTDENGNARITDDTPLSEMSFRQKAGKVVAGLINGSFKFLKSFVGFEDGWKGFKNGGWKRLLANVGVAAGAIALAAIPGVGPVLSAGFLWLTRADAIKNAGQGIYKMCTAETGGDLEAAAEHIGVALVEVAGGKAASKRIRVKGGMRNTKFKGIKGIFKKFKAELKATKNSIETEKRIHTFVKQARHFYKTTTGKSEFKRYNFVKQRRMNNKYCANKMAYEEQKQQMLDELKNGKEQNIFKQLFQRFKNSDKNSNTNLSNNEQKVINVIKEDEELLKLYRETEINLTKKSEIDKALSSRRWSLFSDNRVNVKELKSYRERILSGNGLSPREKELSSIVKNDFKARALFEQEITRLIRSERQFNRQYRQLYRSRQKAMGAQIARGIESDKVVAYTGKSGKFGQLWALNKKPQDMGWMRYIGKFALKTAWQGPMLMYNGCRATLGTSFSVYPIVRTWFKPDALDGEFVSKDDIAKLEQETEAYKNQLAQLEEIKTQAEKYYA